MTAIRRDGNEEPFNAWVRNHTELGSMPHQAALSIHDLDFIIHKYVVKDKSTGRPMARQHMMLIELKTRGGKVSPAQRDTLSVLNRFLQIHPIQSVLSPIRGQVMLHYHGMHLLKLSGTTPKDSSCIQWDGIQIDEEKLVDLLLFKLNPKTLLSREDRSHHKDYPAFGFMDVG